MTGEDLLGRLICMTPEQRKYNVFVEIEGKLAWIGNHYVKDPDYSPNGNQKAFIALKIEEP